MDCTFIVDLYLVFIPSSSKQNMFLLLLIFFQLSFCSETLLLRKLDSRQKQPERYVAAYLKPDALRGHRLWIKTISVKEGENIQNIFLSTKKREERWSKLQSFLDKIWFRSCNNMVLNNILLTNYLSESDDESAFADNFVDQLTENIENKFGYKFVGGSPVVVVRFDGLKTKYVGENVYDSIENENEPKTTENKSKGKSMFNVLGRVFGRDRSKDQQTLSSNKKEPITGSSKDSPMQNRPLPQVPDSNGKEQQKDTGNSQRSDKNKTNSNPNANKFVRFEDVLASEKAKKEDFLKYDTVKDDKGFQSELPPVTEHIYSEPEEVKPSSLSQKKPANMNVKQTQEKERQLEHMSSKGIFAH